MQHSGSHGSLNHSVMTWLQALVASGAPPGSLDHCLETILPLLEGGLFGASADTQEATKDVSKHKEVKHMKAYESYEALARLTTFGTHVETLLLTVRSSLDRAMKGCATV